MAVSSTGSFPQLPKNGNVQLTNASGTTSQVVYTGGANGSKIMALFCTNTDTVNHDVNLIINNGTSDFIFAVVQSLAGAGGSSAVPPTNLFDPSKAVGLPLDSDGNPYIFLASASYTLKVQMVVALAATKISNVTCFAADW